MPGMHIRSMDDLEQVREQWHDVYEASGMKLPVLTYEYVKLWYECFASPKDIRVFRVMEEDKIIGFLPMVVRTREGVRVLSNQTNDHCFYGEALVRRGCEATFKEKILSEILNESGWDVMHQMPGYSFSAMYPLLLESLLARSKHRWRQNIQPSYTIQLNNTFNEYFQNDLSSNMRKSLKLKTNRLKKSGSHNYLHYRGAEAVKLWKELLRIEDSGWKGKNGSSILKATSEYRRYYDGFIQILASTDDLHLYFLELNQKNIAAVFGFTSGNIFQYLKIGYDEEYQNLSPSNMLFMYLVKDIQENYKNIKRIHLFPFDDTGYKRKFTNEESFFSEVIIYKETIAGRRSYFIDCLKMKMRKNQRVLKFVKQIIEVVKIK